MNKVLTKSGINYSILILLSFVFIFTFSINFTSAGSPVQDPNTCTFWDSILDIFYKDDCGSQYVGMTENIEKRMNQHFSGNGAKWTQKNKPISINHIQQCRNKDNAKKAETIVYKKMRDYHGMDKVRGAGHTKST